MNNFFKSITKSSLKYFQDFINRLSFPVKLIITTILCISIFITLSAFLIIQNIQSNIDHQIEILNYNLKATQTIAQVSAQALLLNYKNNNVRNKKLNELINNFSKEHPEVRFAIITDNAGNILCKSHFADLYGLAKPNSQKISPPRHV